MGKKIFNNSVKDLVALRTASVQSFAGGTPSAFPAKGRIANNAAAASTQCFELSLARKRDSNALDAILSMVDVLLERRVPMRLTIDDAAR
mmetsp:Transcript_27455/g.60169  ORF Transcript_27455/g.60169 Transcript_27455/m.60169 type:complete len:90 (-) Transcript_27455:997-1266(-)